jgi:hypothetical protein
VQNLSNYQTIFRIQILVVITCTVLMGALVVLILSSSGEAIIEKRAEGGCGSGAAGPGGTIRPGRNGAERFP